MKTPDGKECVHFFGDYYRGRNFEECRLLKAHGEHWTRDLCVSCPVPEISRANSCQHMKLKARVGRPLWAVFQRRVLISAFCEKTARAVGEPQIGCGECHVLPFKFDVKE